VIKRNGLKMPLVLKGYARSRVNKKYFIKVIVKPSRPEHKKQQQNKTKTKTKQPQSIF